MLLLAPWNALGSALVCSCWRLEGALMAPCRAPAARLARRGQSDLPISKAPHVTRVTRAAAVRSRWRSLGRFGTGAGAVKAVSVP